MDGSRLGQSFNVGSYASSHVQIRTRSRFRQFSGNETKQGRETDCLESLHCQQSPSPSDRLEMTSSACGLDVSLEEVGLSEHLVIGNLSPRLNPDIRGMYKTG